METQTQQRSRLLQLTHISYDAVVAHVFVFYAASDTSVIVYYSWYNTFYIPYTAPEKWLHLRDTIFKGKNLTRDLRRYACRCTSILTFWSKIDIFTYGSSMHYL